MNTSQAGMFLPNTKENQGFEYPSKREQGRQIIPSDEGINSSFNSLRNVLDYCVLRGKFTHLLVLIHFEHRVK